MKVTASGIGFNIEVSNIVYALWASYGDYDDYENNVVAVCDTVPRVYEIKKDAIKNSWITDHYGEVAEVAWNVTMMRLNQFDVPEYRGFSAEERQTFVEERRACGDQMVSNLFDDDGVFLGVFNDEEQMFYDRNNPARKFWNV